MRPASARVMAMRPPASQRRSLGGGEGETPATTTTTMRPSERAALNKPPVPRMKPSERRAMASNQSAPDNNAPRGSFFDDDDSRSASSGGSDASGNSGGSSYTSGSGSRSYSGSESGSRSRSDSRSGSRSDSRSRSGGGGESGDRSESSYSTKSSILKGGSDAPSEVSSADEFEDPYAEPQPPVMPTGQEFQSNVVEDFNDQEPSEVSSVEEFEDPYAEPQPPVMPTGQEFQSNVVEDFNDQEPSEVSSVEEFEDPYEEPQPPVMSTGQEFQSDVVEENNDWAQVLAKAQALKDKKATETAASTDAGLTNASKHSNVSDGGSSSQSSSVRRLSSSSSSEGGSSKDQALITSKPPSEASSEEEFEDPFGGATRQSMRIEVTSANNIDMDDWDMDAEETTVKLAGSQVDITASNVVASDWDVELPDDSNNIEFEDESHNIVEAVDPNSNIAFDDSNNIEGADDSSNIQFDGSNNIEVAGANNNIEFDDSENIEAENTDYNIEFEDSNNIEVADDANIEVDNANNIMVPDSFRSKSSRSSGDSGSSSSSGSRSNSEGSVSSKSASVNQASETSKPLSDKSSVEDFNDPFQASTRQSVVSTGPAFVANAVEENDDWAKVLANAQAMRAKKLALTEDGPPTNEEKSIPVEKTTTPKQETKKEVLSMKKDSKKSKSSVQSHSSRSKASSSKPSTSKRSKSSSSSSGSSIASSSSQSGTSRPPVPSPRSSKTKKADKPSRRVPSSSGIFAETFNNPPPELQKRMKLEEKSVTATPAPAPIAAPTSPSAFEESYTSKQSSAAPDTTSRSSKTSSRRSKPSRSSIAEASAVIGSGRSMPQSSFDDSYEEIVIEDDEDGDNNERVLEAPSKPPKPPKPSKKSRGPESSRSSRHQHRHPGSVGVQGSIAEASALSSSISSRQSGISQSTASKTNRKNKADRRAARAQRAKEKKLSSPLMNIMPLEEAGILLSPDKESIYASVKCDEFLKAAELAYKKLLEVRPRLKYLFSLSEWRHVHALILYARVWECELSAAKIRRHTEFRIDVPKDLKILAPLAAVLRSVGVVDDDGLGAIYIPVARKLGKHQKYTHPDPEDVTEFLEWTQYDWKGSWLKVEAERTIRKKAAAEQEINPPDPLAPPERQKDRGADWETQAVELWLRYDADLWFSYMQAASILSRRASFVDFPRNPRGSYAWLIPRQESEDKNTGPVCRMPRQTLPRDDWVIALLFNLSTLPRERTCTWYHRIQAAKSSVEMMDQFIGSAIR